MSNVIQNGDFSSDFDYWDNGVGGEAYTLDAGKARGSSSPTSAVLRVYQMLQNFNLTMAVDTGEITVWCKWLAYYGGISHGSNRFIVKLQKPDTSYVTLLDIKKTGISGNGNLLDGVDIKAHLNQAGTYWLYLRLETISSCSENPDPPPTYSYGVSYGWYDNIAIDITYLAGTNMKIKAVSAWKDAEKLKIAVGGAWKPGVKAWQAVGGVWRVIFG